MQGLSNVFERNTEGSNTDLLELGTDCDCGLTYQQRLVGFCSCFVLGWIITIMVGEVGFASCTFLTFATVRNIGSIGCHQTFQIRHPL